MKKVILLLILPLLCTARIQVTTYMPLEQFFLEKIASTYIITKNITKVYTSEFKELVQGDLVRLSRTKAYFHFGLEVEKKYAQVLTNMNPNLKVYDLSKGVEKIDGNPYFWTDPLRLRKVVNNIYEALLELSYYNKDMYMQNRDKLLKEIDDIFLKVRDKLYSSEIYNIFVFDKYWHYFARRYSLNLYNRNKTVLEAKDIEKTREFVDLNQIKTILIKDDKTLAYALALKKHTELPIKKHNIFDRLYFFNLEKLSIKLSK